MLFRSSRQSNLPDFLYLWAPISCLSAAVAEVLCYNETIAAQKSNVCTPKRIIPKCFYADENHIKFICFKGSNQIYVHLFQATGLFKTIRSTSLMMKNQFTSYTIRHRGQDPRSWVNQILDTYKLITRTLSCNLYLSNRTTTTNTLNYETEILENVYYLISEALKLHTGKIVHVESNDFPHIVNRVHRLYGVTLNYETVRVPCTELKPCLQIHCPTCTCTSENDYAHKTRSYASKAFIDVDYVVPITPEFVKKIWNRPVFVNS